jgi:hypothetical protein
MAQYLINLATFAKPYAHTIFIVSNKSYYILKYSIFIS